LRLKSVRSLYKEIYEIINQESSRKGMLQKNKDKLSSIYTKTRENYKSLRNVNILHSFLIEIGITYVKDKAIRTANENSGDKDKTEKATQTRLISKQS
jgi:hypothetical protein